MQELIDIGYLDAITMIDRERMFEGKNDKIGHWQIMFGQERGHIILYKANPLTNKVQPAAFDCRGKHSLARSSLSVQGPGSARIVAFKLRSFECLCDLEGA